MSIIEKQPSKLLLGFAYITATVLYSAGLAGIAHLAKWLAATMEMVGVAAFLLFVICVYLVMAWWFWEWILDNIAMRLFGWKADFYWATPTWWDCRKRWIKKEEGK